jgi:hypothetical protein
VNLGFWFQDRIISPHLEIGAHWLIPQESSNRCGRDPKEKRMSTLFWHAWKVLDSHLISLVFITSNIPLFQIQVSAINYIL